MHPKLIPINPRAGWMGWWPGWRTILDPENGRIHHFLVEEISKLANDIKILDASAGKRPYAPLFKRQRYQSCDVPGGFYKIKHDFECYLDDIPQPDASYEVIALTQVLEHVPDPEKVLKELARITKSDGKLLISVPLNCPLHGEPWHFFNFTHYGLAELANRSGWRIEQCEKLGGAFWILGKRLADLPHKLIKSVDPFRAKKRRQSILACIFWTLAFLPFWLVLMPILSYIIRPLCYWMDRFDIEKSFTFGYTAVLRKI
jgi:SAM-dependent methyltransferase